MNPNEHAAYWEWLFDELELFVGKALPVLAIMVGFFIKIGDDLINKRQLTWGQRAGVYMVTLGFGLMGWWITRGLEYKADNWRMPIIIITFGYSGEHVLKWAVNHKEKIINWLLFRTTKNKE